MIACYALREMIWVTKYYRMIHYGYGLPLLLIQIDLAYKLGDSFSDNSNAIFGAMYSLGAIKEVNLIFMCLLS